MQQRGHRWRPDRFSPAKLGLTLALIVAGPVPGNPATPARGLKTITYHGYMARVPASWPVYRLAEAPHTCVRFDRHALYLGVPGRQQACPGRAIGRTEAILVEPTAASAAGSIAAGARLAGSGTTLWDRHAGVVVIATWGRDMSLIRRLLGRISTVPAATRRARDSGASQSQVASTVYTGPGFDACHTPSAQQMSAWSSSYQAIGVYIGGADAACPPGPNNPNLTQSWVSQEVAAGWHLIPIYVGLQAPANSCSCTAMSSNPTQASAQGTAAADDAVADMQALGLPTGNPIYFDMEAYSRTQTNTKAVLAFLSGWTQQVHTDGYVSGVYSSAASGVSDLASQWGTSYAEPDDIWFAQWNGQATTTTSYLPAADWSNHQRLHQYQGDHNETHGGVTMDIDSDYLDGSTAASGGQSASASSPSVSVAPIPGGTTRLTMSWTGASGVSSWQVLGGPGPSALVPVAKVSAGADGGAQATVRGTDAYFEAQALGSSGQVLGQTSPVATPAHITVFGHSAFVSITSGIGGLPVGCYASSACGLSVGVSAGRTTLARTGPELVAGGGVGLLHFALTSAARRLLAAARGRTLAVKVTVRDRSGLETTAAVHLVGYMTSGRAPRRSTGGTGVISVVGLTAFVSPGGTGGVLAACHSPTPCWVVLRLWLGRRLLARTGREPIGANELGYVQFRLSSRNRAALDRTRGNQLGARVKLTGGAVTATAGIVLTRF